MSHPVFPTDRSGSHCYALYGQARWPTEVKPPPQGGSQMGLAAAPSSPIMLFLPNSRAEPSSVGSFACFRQLVVLEPGMRKCSVGHSFCVPSWPDPTARLKYHLSASCSQFKFDLRCLQVKIIFITGGFGFCVFCFVGGHWRRGLRWVNINLSKNYGKMFHFPTVLGVDTFSTHAGVK